MSDDAIDYALEEQLKAEYGYRELWVRFASGETKRVRTFPDTIEWRMACDRLALELLSDPDVERCWSVPMGARGGVERRGTPASVGSTVRPSLPSGRCCEPTRYAGPSGVRLRHANDCTYRGEPYRAFASVPPREGAPPARRRLARVLAMETRRVGLDSDLPADAGGVLAVVQPDGGCPAHPSEPVYGCVACSERRL